MTQPWRTFSAGSTTVRLRVSSLSLSFRRRTRKAAIVFFRPQYETVQLVAASAARVRSHTHGMATKEDKQWVASLTNNRTGRRLANHLSSMELSNQSDGRDCAATESVANERVFIYAIARAVYH